MNRTSPVLKLSRAIWGFIQYKTAEALSSRTIVSYEHDLNLWLDFMADDPDVASLDPQSLRNYLAWLRTDYKPHRFSGDERPLSAEDDPQFVGQSIGLLYVDQR
jgi:integrase/recombinase XerD